MEDLKIKYIEELNCEEGGFYVAYNVKDVNSIAIIEAENEAAAAKELMKKSLEELINKIDINKCSNLLKDLILECKNSTNDTLFIESDNEDYTEKDIEQLENEVAELGRGLNNYIEFYFDGETPITVYGRAVTLFKY